MAGKLSTYRKYYRVVGTDLAALGLLLPTLEAPHWTLLFVPLPGSKARPEHVVVGDLLDILGPALDNPKYVQPGGKEEVTAMQELTVEVDLEVGFHNIDESGYVWTWLTDARDASVIRPDAIVVVADDDALAMARIVDLAEEENGTVVHVDVLPGPLRSYFEAVGRSAR